MFQRPVNAQEVMCRHEARLRRMCLCMWVGCGGGVVMTYEEGEGAEIVVSTEKQFVSVFNIIPDDL